MTFKEKVALYRRLDVLIKAKAAGSPNELCDRLGISRASLTRAINFLRNEYDAPIAFCFVRGTYVYREEFRLTF